MRRHRSGAPQQEESSSDEEDAFAKMPTRKNKKAKIEVAKIKEEPNDEPFATNQSATGSPKEGTVAGAGTSATTTTMPPSQPNVPALSATVTSSMKRHHSVLSDTRKAKMDALLMELEEAKQKARRTPYPRSREVKGSFVESGEEHLTTNIFVGNLPSTMTEERLTDLFQQFGELYSVKIMWPRSTEQEARSRLTGFVCFTNRPEAEDAMEACDDTDPFNCGRRLAMRWGKNVKNSVNQGDGVKSDPARKPAGPGAHGDQTRRSKPIRVMPARDMRKNGSQGGALLTEAEIEEFHRLTRWELCAARDPICRAMAFCFEKSGAAKHIADMLKDLVMERTPEISLGTRVARLYLISDVLYNSQQPGVRNAFLYRDAIERMAPDVFTGLGKHGDGKIGRITMSKLAMAVSTVLDAWANWSVYNPTFLEELHARFEGREIKNESTAGIKKEQHDEESTTIKEEAQQKDQHVEPATDTVDSIRATPRGDWTTLTGVDDIDLDNADDVDGECIDENDIDGEGIDENEVDGELIGDAELDGGVESFKVETSSNPPLNEDNNVHDDNRVSHDADGQPVDNDVDIDGECIDENDIDIDGEDIDENEVDGEFIDDAELDGGVESLEVQTSSSPPLNKDNNHVPHYADRQPLDNYIAVDGIPLDQDDADGEPLDEDDDVDGEPFDVDDADGEPPEEDGAALREESV